MAVSVEEAVAVSVAEAVAVAVAVPEAVAGAVDSEGAGPWGPALGGGWAQWVRRQRMARMLSSRSSAGWAVGGSRSPQARDTSMWPRSSEAEPAATR